MPPAPSDHPAIPRAAMMLGLAGLAPFFASALAAYAGEPMVRGFAQASFAIYAAVILSFLGGVRWGLALRHTPVPAMTLLFAVVPSIAGWLAALSLISGAGFGLGGVFAILFLVQFLWDRSSPGDGAPLWYPQLRLILTLGVLTACLIAAGAGVLV